MRRIALAVAYLALAALAGPARADEIEVRDLALRAAENGMLLDADFAFQLSPRLADMLSNGVPLHFNVDFQLTRRRWYWFDENTAFRRLQLGLSYHLLTRQYRLSTGPQQQAFATLEEALQALMHVRNWLVIDRTVSFADADYQAAVRMRLDAALLPKPFQLSALTSPDLQLESDWKRFTLRSPRHLPAPVETRAQETR
ncbi:MAG: DUF4390 domain-containing protein [Betaproteobacteria bacterium]